MHVALLAALLAASPLSPLPTRSSALPAGAKVAAADPGAPQSLRLSLQLPNRAALDALIAAQRDPTSPEYRRWLTPAEFGERFGQSAADYQALVDALTKAGFGVKTFHSRMYVEAEGTVAGMERFLGVHFVDVTAADGTRFRSYKGAPQLPATLAKIVLSAGGLDTRQRFHHRLLASGSQTFGPQDLRRYYDIAALHALGYAGQLSRVALIGAIPDTADQAQLPQVQYFYDAVSNSSSVPVIDQLPLGGSQADNEPGINVELQMDMEMPTVAAPQLQTVTLVEAPGDTLFTSAFNEINENLADTTTASTSFGGCEQAELQSGGASDVTATSNLIAQGAVEGIAYFDAAGDSGVADCDNEFATGESFPAVDFPTSVPYIISVGGTEYTGGFDSDNAVTAYGDEAVWNQESGEAVGGGGQSILFNRPWYQAVPGQSDGGAREVPDIALLADVTPGVAIVDMGVGVVDADGNGTSDASPMAAGMFALINDVIGGCRLGSPAPELYVLGRAQYGAAGTAVFHDITTGNISAFGVTGPSAHTGYDEASGLGSLDVAALAMAWPPCPAAPVPDAGILVDAGFGDGGLAIVWPGGAALDAGPRPAYDPCGILDCDGGALADFTCATIPEGPAACIQTCDPAGANPCGPGEFCAPLNDGGACTEGCSTTADCTSLDGGLDPDGGANYVCLSCASACVFRGNPAGTVGSACSTDTDCATGGACIPSQDFFPGGYCTMGCGASASTCSCPSGSTCLAADQFCAESCSVSAGGPCRSGYVCDPLDTTDNGVCLPACLNSTECGFFEAAGSTCDTALGGICIPPGVTPPTLTSSSSGSSGSSTSASTSSGSSGTHGSSSGTHGSSSGGHGASSSGTASSTSTTTGTSGTSTTSSGATTASASAAGSTGGATAAATTGSTGASSSGKGAKTGCGCSSGASLDSAWALLGGLALVRRRRRVAQA